MECLAIHFAMQRTFYVYWRVRVGKGDALSLSLLGKYGLTYFWVLGSCVAAAVIGGLSGNEPYRIETAWEHAGAACFGSILIMHGALFAAWIGFADDGKRE